MEVFHPNDTYLKYTWRNCSTVYRATRLYPDKQHLSFNDGMRSGEDLFAPHPSLCNLTKDLGYHIDKLEAMRHYQHTMVTFLCNDQIAANHPYRFLVLAYDWCLTPGPKENFPEINNWAGRFRRLVPLMRNKGNTYSQRTHHVCYVGRAEGRRRPTWMCAIMDNHWPWRFVMSERGTSFMPVYQMLSEYFEDITRDPDREEIEIVFNNSKFLLYMTDFGSGVYETLENSVMEAIMCGCMPVLNSKWCQHRYKGYPAQVGSIDEARALKLDEGMYNACVKFWENLNEPHSSCFTEQELRDEIARVVALGPNPRRSENIDMVIDMIKSGKHLGKISWD